MFPFVGKQSLNVQISCLAI